MVDDQVGGDERIDLVGITAQLDDGVTHGGEVHHGGHAGKVLQHHASRHERDLEAAVRLRGPPRHGRHMVLGDDTVACVAQHVLEQDADGEWQTLQIGESGLRQRIEPIDRQASLREGQGRSGMEWIRHG